MLRNCLFAYCCSFSAKDQSPRTKIEIKSVQYVPYYNAIASVMYLMVSKRPNIDYDVSCLSRYMSNSGTPHWESLKWLLRYFKVSNTFDLKSPM